jgi:hypothetical protein
MFKALRSHNILISIFLSGFILFTAQNTASYGHIHRLADGSIAYHIHPFQKSDSAPKHSHTKADFEFLSISSLSQFTESDASIVTILYPKYTHLDCISDASQLNSSELCFSKNGRSPPALV